MHLGKQKLISMFPALSLMISPVILFHIIIDIIYPMLQEVLDFEL